MTGEIEKFPTRVSAARRGNLVSFDSPLGSTRWGTKEDQDPLELLKQEFTKWMQIQSENEHLFKRFVYDNQETNELDFRQHRARLCDAVSVGEDLAVAFSLFGIKAGAEDEVKPLIEVIDRGVKKSLDILFSWHGPLAAQQDIPDSFKQGAADIDAGRIVDFDKVLTDAPSEAAV